MYHIDLDTGNQVVGFEAKLNLVAYADTIRARATRGGTLRSPLMSPRGSIKILRPDQIPDATIPELGDRVRSKEEIAYRFGDVKIPAGATGTVTCEDPLRVYWYGTDVKRGTVTLDVIDLIKRPRNVPVPDPEPIRHVRLRSLGQSSLQALSTLADDGVSTTASVASTSLNISGALGLGKMLTSHDILKSVGGARRSIPRTRSSLGMKPTRGKRDTRPQHRTRSSLGMKPNRNLMRDERKHSQPVVIDKLNKEALPKVPSPAMRPVRPPKLS